MTTKYDHIEPVMRCKIWLATEVLPSAKFQELAAARARAARDPEGRQKPEDTKQVGLQDAPPPEKSNNTNNVMQKAAFHSRPDSKSGEIFLKTELYCSKISEFAQPVLKPR